MEVLTKGEKEAMLKMRAKRLQTFAEKLGERGLYLIEHQAYAILETYRSRPRAIWRYIRTALRVWRGSLWFSIQFALRVWWNRRVKGLDHGKAIDLACAAIEERIFPAPKGVKNGRPN